MVFGSLVVARFAVNTIIIELESNANRWSLFIFRQPRSLKQINRVMIRKKK